MLNEIIRRTSLLDRAKRSNGTLEEIASENGVSRRTLSRILQRDREGKELIDLRHNNPGRKSGVTDEALGYALQYLEIFPKAGFTGVIAAMEEGEYGYKGSIPTNRQLRYTLQHLPLDMRAMMLDGTKNYLNEVAMIPRREEERVNAVWQIDATELPVHAIDELTGKLIKPWLLSAIDSFSRVVVLAKVCRYQPTRKDALLAIQEAILPKNNPMFFAYGVPTVMIPDNHSIFTSPDFKDSARLAGIRLEFPPKEAPLAKGKCERFFRTVQEQLCARLIGYADQSSGLHKARQAALPVSCIQPLVDKYLLKYHSKTHSAIKMAPWIRWQENAEFAEGLLFNGADIKKAFRLRIESTVGKDGICTPEGWHLISPDLIGLSGEKVILRVPLDGTSNGVEAYWNDHKVADLTVVEGNTDMADAINKGKIRRTEELRAFRKMMRSRIKKVPKFKTDARKVGKENVESETPEKSTRGNLKSEPVQSLPIEEE